MAEQDPGTAGPSAELPEPLRRRARAALLRGLVHSAGVLPPAVLGSALRPLSRLAFRHRYGRTIASNLALALPRIGELDPQVAARLTSDPSRFTREVADFVAEQATHWIRLARGAAPDSEQGVWIEDLVEIDPSIERLDAVLAAGRGAIVITAHIGDWELLCARIRRRGQGGAVVGRVRRRDSSHRWLVDMRRAYGVETIAQDAPPRQALRLLRAGGVLGLLTDLRVKRLDGHDIPFFGVPAHTMTAPASFARAHRAPLVPIRCVRPAGSERYLLSVEEPLELRSDLPRDEATELILTEQNRLFERWILETPEQWAWHQRRFDPVNGSSGH